MTTVSIGQRILGFHDEIGRVCHNLDRVCVAVFDSRLGELKTIAASSDCGWPLRCYQARLSEVPSLEGLARTRKPRVIDDLKTLQGGLSRHTQALLESGYRSSYTVPLCQGGSFLGFLFFDSREPAYFTAERRQYLEPYVSLLAGLVVSQLTSAQSLGRAMREAFPDSGEDDRDAHQLRVTQYVRLIARELAEQAGLSDEFVDYLCQFAPLHDIGNIAVPVALLYKKGRFAAHEYRVAQSHVAKGREIVAVMLRRFHLEGAPFASVLHNLVVAHHERYDGSGYPRGLAGADIPLEGRILAVADVFDALTSARPYRPLRSAEYARAYLVEHRGILFDPDCVDALVKRWDSFCAVNTRFHSSAA